MQQGRTELRRKEDKILQCPACTKVKFYLVKLFFQLHKLNNMNAHITSWRKIHFLLWGCNQNNLNATKVLNWSLIPLSPKLLELAGGKSIVYLGNQREMLFS